MAKIPDPHLGAFTTPKQPYSKFLALSQDTREATDTDMPFCPHTKQPCAPKSDLSLTPKPNPIYKYPPSDALFRT